MLEIKKYSHSLFVLAGNLMTQGRFKEFIRLAAALTAPIPSGMVIASVLRCAIFAVISGSSPITLIAVGTILYPALIEGYSKKLSIEQAARNLRYYYLPVFR